MDGASFFEASLGLEEISGTFRNPLDEEQVVGYYTQISQFIQGRTPAEQVMRIQQQLSAEEDGAALLESLNPHVPENLMAFLKGRGVHYDLESSEYKLRIWVTLVNSLFVKGGLYMSIEYQFSPNQYDFGQEYTIAKGFRELILRELGLRVLLEVPK